MVEAAPRQAFGGSEGLGGAEPPAGIFRNPAGLRPKWGHLPQSPQETLDPLGEPPRQTLFKTTTPREALKPPRSLEILRGHGLAQVS